MLEVVDRGGARAVAAGAKHSVVAVALPEHERCPASCSGADNGECVAGECRCVQPWTGESCALPGCAPACSVHSVCAASLSGGGSECVCDSGWSGVSCSEPVCPSYGGEQCGGHGTCSGDPAVLSSTPTCTCDAGWTGASCAVPDCTVSLGACNARGSCVCASGASACASTGGAPTCSCDDPWRGDTCSVLCPTALGGLACGGHGTCVAGSPPPPPSPPGTTSASLPPSAPLEATCVCDELWYGTACESNSCPSNSAGVCGGPLRGTCTYSSGSASCVCQPGWGGSECGDYACLNDCSGRGTCAPDYLGRPRCVCNVGSAGDDCSNNNSAIALGVGIGLGGAALVLFVAVIAVYKGLLKMRRKGRSGTVFDAWKWRRWTTTNARAFDKSSMHVHMPSRATVYPSRFGVASI